MASVPLPAFLAAPNESYVNGVSSFSRPRPDNALPGDFVCGVLFAQADVTLTDAQGFTVVGSVYDGGIGQKTWFLWKILTDADMASASPWTFAFSGSVGAFGGGRFAAYSHPHPGGTVVAAMDSAYQGTSTTHTFPTVTTLAANSRVIGCAAGTSPTDTFSPPSGWSEDSDQSATAFASVNQVSAGSTGAISYTTPSQIVIACTFAIQPNTLGARLYLDSAAAAPVSPANFHSAWDATGAALTRALVATPGSSTMTSTGVAEAVSTNPYDVAIYRGVYGPIGAGTISGLFRAIARAQESNAAADFISQVTIRLLQPDGSQRSVLYAGHNSTTIASEWATTLTNRWFPGPAISRALSSQDAQNGDFLEVTLGYRSLNSSTTSRTGTLRHGDTAASDAEPNETATADNRPWIQIDSGLPIYSAGPVEKSSSDELSVEAADAEDGLMAALSRTDAATVSLADVRDALAVSLARTDGLAVTLSDVLDTLRAVLAADDALEAAVLDEVDSLAAVIAAVDATTAATTEAVDQVVAQMDRSDTLTAAVVDVYQAIAVVLVADDAATVSVDDVVDSVAAVVEAADALTLAGDETAAVLPALHRSDDLTVAATDAPAPIAAQLERADALAVSASDAAALLLSHLSADALSVRVVEGPSEIAVVALSADALELRAQDLSDALTAALSRQDGLLVALAEAPPVLFVPVASADDATVAVEDASSVVVALGRIDGLAVQTLDASAPVAVRVVTSEQLRTSLVDDAGLLAALAAADAITVHVDERGHAAAVITATDAVALSLAEVADRLQTNIPALVRAVEIALVPSSVRDVALGASRAVDIRLTVATCRDVSLTV